MRYRWYYIYEDHYFQLKKEIKENTVINKILQQNILDTLNTGTQVPGVFEVDVPFINKKSRESGKNKKIYGINYEINLNNCFELFSKEKAYDVITWFYTYLLTHKQFYIFPSTEKITSKSHESSLEYRDNNVNEE